MIFGPGVILSIPKQFYLCPSPDRIFITKTAFKVAYENNDKRPDSVHSIRVKAGKRRTYFFDVRETRGNDFYVTITESRKRFDSDGYDRHKIFLYKEDFHKFLKGLNETIDHVKTELMPDFDFDAFNHDNYDEQENGQGTPAAPAYKPAEEPVAEEKPAVSDNNNDAPSASALHEDVDKW